MTGSDGSVDAAERALAEQVRDAAASATPLRIEGGGSKRFYGRAAAANSRPLSLAGVSGIRSYEPSELVITAAAATPLAEVEAALAERRQMLGFEPPYFGSDATVGGTVACGLSGPRRPYAGAVRDHVLGVRVLNGRGAALRFGGQVMKNVAGYDIARLMTGSLGTLGVILEVSLRVLPAPAAEHSLRLETDERGAIARLVELGRRPLPLSAACHHDGVLTLRLSGAASAVRETAAALGGEPLDAEQAAAFWTDLREQRLAFFDDGGSAPLWRISLAPATGPLGLPGQTLLDWGGAVRWLRGELPADTVFAAARAVGGHAQLFRGGDRGGAVMQPLDPVALKLHQRLKHSFDPAAVFNPGRLYAEF